MRGQTSALAFGTSARQPPDHAYPRLDRQILQGNQPVRLPCFAARLEEGIKHSAQGRLAASTKPGDAGGSCALASLCRGSPASRRERSHEGPLTDELRANPHKIGGIRISRLQRARPAGYLLALSSIHDLEALGLRMLGPELVGPTHRRRSLRAGPPGIVDVVAGPDHQGGDFGGVGWRDEGVAAHEAGSLALCLAIAIQQTSWPRRSCRPWPNDA